MIKIQVLGKGMIPRGYGLAPRTEPFYADLTFIYTIMNTGGLSVRYLNPTTMQFGDLDRSNVKRIYEKYSNADYDKPVAAANDAQKKPHVPPARNVVQHNPAHVNGMTVPLGEVPRMTEKINTNPSQYKSATFNEVTKDLTPEKPAEEAKDTLINDHTNVEEKHEDVTPVQEAKNGDVIAPINNDSIKPVNAPDKNQNHNKNGKK